MSNRAIHALAWAIIFVALVGEIADRVGERPPGDIGPLAIIAAGYLFGARVIRNGNDKQPAS